MLDRVKGRDVDRLSLSEDEALVQFLLVGVLRSHTNGRQQRGEEHNIREVMTVTLPRAVVSPTLRQAGTCPLCARHRRTYSTTARSAIRREADTCRGRRRTVSGRYGRYGTICARYVMVRPSIARMSKAIGAKPGARISI